ncbi:MAG: DUF3168 domain-containing protein [Gammaproteobacteria bacterium]|nr:DUF3168 domain-containing protein [Gammaproteobacteria bacterium]
MTMESDLSTLLKTVCPRVFPDVAPSGTAKPFVTWQGIGGEALGYLDNTAADKRHTLMQVNAWSTTRLQALQLIRDVEAAMRASGAFVATPVGEAMSSYEQDTALYGCIQRFEIYSLR